MCSSDFLVVSVLFEEFGFVGLQCLNARQGIVRLNRFATVRGRNFGGPRFSALDDRQANKGVIPEQESSGRREVGQAVYSDSALLTAPI